MVTEHSAEYVRPALTVGSLFSGIGGIDLGLERAGMKVIWQSELNPHASKVLAKHWPSVPNLGDIKKIDWSHVERPDVVAGGFPCQPVSAAGKQQVQEDPRWLWPEFARCLRDLRPDYVILENVPALLSVAGGRAAQEVFGDLALLGFDADWCRLSAAEFGAPHLRRRLFVIAYAQRDQLRDEQGRLGQQRPEGTLSEREGTPVLAAHGASQSLAHAAGPRDWTFGGGLPGDAGGHGWRTPQDDHQLAGGGSGSGADPWWEAEPAVGRVADGVPSRVDRLRCLGNAVVPQVAEYVGRQLLLLIDGLDPSGKMKP